MSKKPEISTNNECIRVCIRCRPLNSTETAQGNACVVKTNERGEIWVQKPFTNDAPKQFTFDSCYDEKSTQGQIYENTAANIV